jgi:hypothetical protein
MRSPSRIVPAVALVVAVLAVAVLVGACGTPQPSDPPALGTVRVTVHGANAGFFASEQRATLVTPDGRVVADWKLATVGEVPIQAPVGSYTLSTFTVFFSDFMQCIPDPARPGQETCLQPTLGPAERCEAPIEVRETVEVLATFSILADGRCRLELGGAPSPGASA